MMTHAHGKVLLADVHERIHHSVDRLALRQRHGRFGVQDGEDGEQDGVTHGVLALHVTR